MTFTSLLLVWAAEFLGHGARALAATKGPLMEGPDHGFLAMAFFEGPPLRAPLFKTTFCRYSTGTFMPTKPEQMT